MCYLIFFYSTKCTSSNNEFTDQNNIYSDENIQKTGIIRNVELWRKRLRIYYEITRKYPIFTDSLGSVNLNIDWQHKCVKSSLTLYFCE